MGRGFPVLCVCMLPRASIEAESEAAVPCRHEEQYAIPTLVRQAIKNSEFKGAVRAYVATVGDGLLKSARASRRSSTVS